MLIAKKLLSMVVRLHSVATRESVEIIPRPIYVFRAVAGLQVLKYVVSYSRNNITFWIVWNSDTLWLSLRKGGKTMLRSLRSYR